jgi:UDP-N-acetylglucosamine--N-acetylmuramyl-(pentapeptide) pyrophosphoryl-undecaprenol N-acetylglucosamine transferase
VSGAAPIILATGGTGGHVFPAQALAAALIARGRSVVVITDKRGAVFGDAVPTHRIRAATATDSFGGLARAALDIGLGTLQARRLLRRLKPAAVVGFGGYPSLPTMFAAVSLKVPTVIHEQNAVLGRANRLLAPRVGRIATSFEQVIGMGEAERAKAVAVGNPVRPAIARLHGTVYPPPQTDGPLSILVLGGSQGARVFSEVLPAATALLPALLRARISIVQQCRPEDLEAARAAYAALGMAPELSTFFDDVPERLARAQLVIARAGASTMAELAVSGRPAILVPYPHATDDHQTANARALDEAGAAWLVPQDAFRPQTLAARLESLLTNIGQLPAHAAAARAAAHPDAAERLADVVEASAATHPAPIAIGRRLAA